MRAFLWLTAGIGAGLFGLRSIVFIIADRVPDFLAVGELAAAFSVLVYSCAQAAGCLRTAQQKNLALSYSRLSGLGARRAATVVRSRPVPEVPSIGYTSSR